MVELNRNFKYAIRDLVWLLDKGYPKRSSIDLVGNRYMLGRDERQILLRGVYSREACKERRRKLVESNEFNIDHIIIDGLNVLITIHSYLLGKPVFRSLDGYTRDISGVYGNFTYEERTKRAFDLLTEVLKSILKAVERRISVHLFLDYKASKVGDFAGYMRGVLSEEGIHHEVVVDKNCDHLIVETEGRMQSKSIVATSDTVIIDRVEKTVDIPSLTIEVLLNKKILDLKGLSGLRSIA